MQATKPSSLQKSHTRPRRLCTALGRDTAHLGFCRPDSMSCNMQTFLDHLPEVYLGLEREGQQVVIWSPAFSAQAYGKSHPPIHLFRLRPFLNQAPCSVHRSRNE
jgi:hypothetical protein